jgi:O-antigen ligase
MFPTAFEMVVANRIVELFTQFYTTENSTIYAIASNIRYAIAKVCDGHILGTGYDSNRYYYRDYVDKLYHKPDYYLNEEDAASLFTRILSEFGIVGLVSTIGYLFKRAIENLKKHDWIITVMISMFLFQGARNGQYYLTMMVIPTVFLLYYDKDTP